VGPDLRPLPVRLDWGDRRHRDLALREKIGDEPFFRILRNWTAEHAQGNATTEQFIDLAERISGQDLTAFFQTWLYTTTKPTTW
jgi:aminopeptidase N